MTSRISDRCDEAALAERAGRLLHADAVRRRAHHLLELALAGDVTDWKVDLDRLPATADFVTEVVRNRYPQLDVPVHSRWRHFVFEGHDAWNTIVTEGRWNSADEAARSAFDLVITSVLLDAGAGAEWRYRDRTTNLRLARSEGLALASLRWVASGELADDRVTGYRVDAGALRRIDRQAIAIAFQAGRGNELLGLDGRARLLNRLGEVMESRPDLFAIADSPRPGGLFDALRARTVNGQLPATKILEILLHALGPMWQSRPSLGGVPLGDCWPHPALRGSNPEDHYMPLHKLSQWLSYSLIEPLQSAGIAVSDVDLLTGLAEYRNGGLLVDMGVLVPREPHDLTHGHAVASPFVVGWRGLTVALLDRLAPLVVDRLGVDPALFPLARVLEGGTWAAGRLIARKARADGGPPFKVLSDGTVF